MFSEMLAGPDPANGFSQNRASDILKGGRGAASVKENDFGLRRLCESGIIVLVNISSVQETASTLRSMGAKRLF
jgi:hypothetical protein